MTNCEKVIIITSLTEAGTVETLPFAPEMELIRNEELQKSERRFMDTDKVCVTSEYSLKTVLERLDPVRIQATEALKDKFRFREMLSRIYPGYSFFRVKSEEIDCLSVSRKSIIKPTRGIFGTAVRTIGPDTDFSKLRTEIEEELQKNAKVYPDSVLSGNEFLVEDFIEGEEYAVDMFYDSAGNPCIVNIMHHPLPVNVAYLHMMYNSTKAAFEKVYQEAKYFFTQLNKMLRVTNFVLHAEFRFHHGMIIPVEINPMRFGGMGLCNLAWYAFEVNPFIYWLKEKEPDWNEVWAGRNEKVYTFFIAYNGVNSHPDQYFPRPDKLKERFTRVIREQLFDHRKQLAFGIYFLEEDEKNSRELLKIEFDEFFEQIPA